MASALPAVFALDAEAEIERIAETIAAAVTSRNCRGAVLGVSGGVDSALCLALAVRALGSGRVLALSMPDRDSLPETDERARALCEQFRVELVHEEITGTLEALGCYRRRDAAIRRLVPSYTDRHRSKIAINGGLLRTDQVPSFSLITESPDGKTCTSRMPANVYREVVAATNMKQRVRKTIEYFHAEQRHAVVVGTANRLEHELGFFVRGGDGLADVKPIAHLYKTQVYDLAGQVGVPAAILDAVPTTDTYSLPQTQEEFYFRFPLRTLDLLVYASANGVAAADAAAAVGLEPDDVERVYADLDAKRRVARRNLADAVLAEPSEPRS
jgi:NAD+ synthase